jgi:hypothetical protein
MFDHVVSGPQEERLKDRKFDSARYISMRSCDQILTNQRSRT